MGSPFSIAGCVALVTGAGRPSGLGWALVEELVASGAHKVYATARDAAQLRRFANDALPVTAIELDVADRSAVRRLPGRCADVNLLVSNAGFLSGNGVLDDVDAAEAEMRVNYLAPLLLAQSFWPLMRTRCSALVMINSIASLVNFSLGSTYSASKAASHSLTQALRRDLALELSRQHSASSLLVSGVYPGPIDTEMTKAVSFPKASAADVARAIVAAVQQGEEDIFPDPVSKQLARIWRRDAKALERQMASAPDKTRLER